MIRLFGRLACLATVAILAVYPQQFGEITGTTTDSTGAVIPGSVVTLTNTATQQVRTATSNGSGVYSLPNMLPGAYDFRAEKTGFKVSIRRGVEIQVGDVIRGDFALELGEVSQQVEVAGATELLNTESSTMGSVVGARQIVDLPLNGRDYLSLVTLSTNASAEGGGTGGSGLQGGVRGSTAISVAGQRLEYNHYTLDGAENTDPNFNSYIIHPSVDALQEFKVQTGIYSAEFGRGASQINVNTLPGTNAYHGAAFEFLRNFYLDARPWNVTGTKTPFRRNDYGFTLGGPIMTRNYSMAGTVSSSPRISRRCGTPR
jgi:Carboxypeptidase regulatory-like domain